MIVRRVTKLDSSARFIGVASVKVVVLFFVKMLKTNANVLGKYIIFWRNIFQVELRAGTVERISRTSAYWYYKA